jgi:hypothetical protein
LRLDEPNIVAAVEFFLSETKDRDIRTYEHGVAD